MKYAARIAGSFASTVFGGALWVFMMWATSQEPNLQMAIGLALLSFLSFMVWAISDFIVFRREEAAKRK
jgi:hypothetical protein